MKKGFLFSALMTLLLIIMPADTFSQELKREKCANEYWGYVDKSSNRTIIPCQYEKAKDFSEGLAAVQPLYCYWGFIDKTGKEVIPFYFQQAENFSEGLAAVRLKRKWGFIDKTGNEVIPCKYKEVGNFTGGYAVVQYGYFWGVIDKAGIVIVPCIYNDMQSAHTAIPRAELERERIATQERERVTQEGGNPIITNAYDIILLKSGDEIKAKVLEVTDQQIKYKEFDFQSGPTRNLNISEVFMITYENGRKEVFNKQNASSKRQNVTNCVKNTAFGLDIGIGGNSKYKIFAPALGIRVMHHCSPYFGIDFFKINWLTDVQIYESFNSWAMSLQIMPGVRGNSPTFFKCMSVYSAFRIGYGMQVASGSNIALYHSVTDFKGLCIEAELGINLTPAVFAGFAYNFHKHFGIPAERHTFAFRIGFNFGK